MKPFSICHKKTLLNHCAQFWLWYLFQSHDFKYRFNVNLHGQHQMKVWRRPVCTGAGQVISFSVTDKQAYNFEAFSEYTIIETDIATGTFVRLYRLFNFTFSHRVVHNYTTWLFILHLMTSVQVSRDRGGKNQYAEYNLYSSLKSVII